MVLSGMIKLLFNWNFLCYFIYIVFISFRVFEFIFNLYTYNSDIDSWLENTLMMNSGSGSGNNMPGGSNNGGNSGGGGGPGPQ
jgi:uncharacterized membrane protein YgcG